MIERLQKSMREKDKGFTLIELLVVIVIVGILAGIAIPIFLNQRKKGVDAGVQSDLKALATTAETIYADKGTYDFSAATLTANRFNKTADNDLAAWVSTDGDSFCIQGSNDNGTRGGTDNGGFFWYDSLLGGLVQTADGTAPADGTCAAGGTPIAIS